jgi:DNA-binding MarR family transcriptional regulator
MDNPMTQEDKRAIARALLATVPLLARAIDASMRGVRERLSPAHFTMLSLLSERSMTQAELSERMHVGPSTVSVTVDALETRGWVQRERSQTDRRAVLVILTEEGAAMLEAMDDPALAGLEAAVENLTDEEQAALLNGLKILHKTFDSPEFDEGRPPADVFFMRRMRGPHFGPPPGFRPPHIRPFSPQHRGHRHGHHGEHGPEEAEGPRGPFGPDDLRSEFGRHGHGPFGPGDPRGEDRHRRMRKRHGPDEKPKRSPPSETGGDEIV